MRGTLLKKHNALILLFGFSLQVSLSGFAAEDYAVPRTEWGQPDLQGVWNFSSDVPMQRPEQFGERAFLSDEEIAATALPRFQLGTADQPRKSASGAESFYNDNIWAENVGIGSNVRTSLVVYPPNGRFPRLVKGIENLPGGEVEAVGQRPVRFMIGGIGRDGPEDRGLSERCLMGFNAGPQLTPSVYNNNVQIIQNRDHVVILAEMVHEARIIKLDGSPGIDKSLRLWSGDSRGHWDDDTLIVVTQNFNGLTQSIDGFGTSKHKVLTERITRLGPQTLNYEFTIDDPSTFTDKLTAIVPLTKVPTQLYEYACHEGNYGMANMLRGARRREVNEVSDRVANLFRGQ
jgi:hypothetical protein